MTDEEAREEIARARARAAEFDELERQMRQQAVEETPGTDGSKRAGELVSFAKTYGEDGPPRNVLCMDCGRPCTVTGFGWAAAKIASEQLLRRGEPALALNEITRCSECHEKRQPRIADEYSANHWRGQELLERVRADRHSADDLVELRKLGFGKALDAIVAAHKAALERKDRRRAAKEAPAQTRMEGIE